MDLTYKPELTESVSRVATWALLSAAVVAWIGIVVDLVIRLDLGAVEPAITQDRIAITAVLVGVLCGIANIVWNSRFQALWRQWVFIGVQVASGLVALYFSESITPGTMLIIGMAQIPARTALHVTATFFVVTNLALGWLMLLIEPSTSQAVVVWFLFVGFQLFALTIAVMQQRERAAREALGVVNAELILTRRRLADSARAEERLRVSRELHDVAGHTLTAMTVSLEAQSRKAPDDLKDALLTTRDLSRELLDDIRAVVSHLRLHDAEHVGVALRKLCERIPAAHIHLSGVDDVRILDADRATSVVRCVQEAVTNAIRHGAARNIWIRCEDTEQEMTLTVQDDGTGGTNYRVGNGLRGMQERLLALGGKLNIKPSDANGWMLQFCIPLSEDVSKRVQE